MLRRVLSNALLYFGASAAASGIAFLVLPLYTRVLSPEAFGLLGLIGAASGILSTVVGLSPQLMIVVEFKKMTEKELQPVMAAAIWVPLSLSPVAFALLEALRTPLGMASVPHWILGVMAFLPLFGNATSVYLAVNRMREHSLAVALFQLSGVGVEHGVSLFLVIAAGLSWQGRAAGIFFWTVLFGGIAAVRLWRMSLLRFRLSRAALRRYLTFLIPLVPHALGYWAINAQDRFFIARMQGLDEVGLYAVAYRLCAVFPLVFGAVLGAFSPYLFKETLDQEDKVEIVRFSYLYLGAVALLFLGFVLVVVPFVPWFLGEQFAECTVYLPWLAGAYALGAVRDMSVGYLYRSAQNRVVGATTLVAAGVNAVLNWVLITAMGTVGAAVATTITFGLISAATAWLGLRKVSMPWLRPFGKGEGGKW